MRADASIARILLIDDDVELSAMLRQYLQTEGFQVTVDFTGRNLSIKDLSDQFDALVLDVMLPNLSGIELLRRIRRESAVPIIMLTAKGDEVDRVIGLELGADDYVAKPYYPPELVARLRAVLRRRVSVPVTAEEEEEEEAELAVSDLHVNVPAKRATWKGSQIPLTASEFKMLVALIHSGDRVATKDQLSFSVLGRHRESYDRSVDVHVSNLRQKLEVASQASVEVETVRGFGYRLKVAP